MARQAAPTRSPAGGRVAGNGAALGRAAAARGGVGPRPRLTSACACGGRCPGCLAALAGQAESAVSAQPGVALDATTRDWMAQRFGHRFEGVRVHTESQAAQAAASLDTRAFAVGRHIAFAPGQFQPGSAAGRRLLAHELAHTLQQRHGVGSSSPSRMADSAGEAAAEGAAQAALAGRRVPAQPGHAVGVQRDGPLVLPGLGAPLPMPTYSQPPEGDYAVGTPVRVTEDEYLVPISTGRRFIVRRQRWTTTEDAGRTGREPFTSGTPGADYRQVWFTVE